MLAPAERRRAPDTVALALEVAAAAIAASGRDATDLPCVFASAHGDLAINDYMCSTLASDPDAAVADQVPQLGAQRGGRLLDHRHRLHGGQQFGLRPTKPASPPACSKPRRSARPTSSAVLLVGYDMPAVGALASVTTSRGLLAVALVLAPARTERTVASFDWSLAHGADGRAAPRSRGGARACRPTPWPTRCRCSRRWRAASREALHLPLSATLSPATAARTARLKPP